MTNNRQSFTPIELVLGATLSFVFLPTLSGADELTLPYSARGSTDVTITGRSGIGTSKSIIQIKHTRENALSYCFSHDSKHLKACVDRTMADVKVQKSVTANCKTGRFTDIWGGKFAYVGRVKNSDFDYTIIDVATGLPLNETSLEDYGPRLATLDELCPDLLR